MPSPMFIARKTRQILTQIFVLAIAWLPAAFISFRTLSFLAPGSSRSASNNLLFALSSSDSPLKGSGYPISLTAGVIPKRFHSHNDYVQGIPLLKALSYGASSIEADIWLVEDELYIAHDRSDLDPSRTLKSLYLDRLVSLIEAANHNTPSGAKLRGLFDTAPDLTLHLLIDIKTDGPSTFAKLYETLAPLRAAGYLSTWTSEDKAIQHSLITVIGTGNTPLASVQELGRDQGRPRDVFLDAVLEDIQKDKAGVYDATVSPLASSDFQKSVGTTWMLPPVGRPAIRKLVDAAHARGIQTRFWHTPTMPVLVRNTVWQMLLDEGVDWLNVDDLPAAQLF